MPEETVYAILLVALWSGVAVLVVILGIIAAAIIILTGPHTQVPTHDGEVSDDPPRRGPGLKDLHASRNGDRPVGVF